ncbi:heavy metal-associated isoprenylated plant protein 47-like isoform X1 [Pyrus communis]|uniref:heavy metal-associated isoprenylated plant protein 47-like isoform X1 n=1 Tax=Pyrus communis TaxID=23211 RepID=UPI0035C21DD4
MQSFIDRFIECFCVPKAQSSLSSMKQKIVMKVQLNSEKCRTKALKIAAKTKGVSKVSIEVDKGQVEVIGNGVDAVCLAKLLKNKLGFATIVVVEEVKKEKEEKPAVPIPWISSYLHYPQYHAYYDGFYGY